MKIELSIRELLNTYTFHDSNIYSVQITWDGAILLKVQFDEVWNTSNNVDRIRMVSFNDVYEIIEYKMDRVNIVGTVDYVALEDYDSNFVAHKRMNGLVYIVDFAFVAGGRLTMICEDSITLILKSAPV